MSLLKKLAAVALVVAIAQSAALTANANPLEKLFANAGRKVVGGVSKSVQTNVTQGTRLLLKTAPYALLQGNRSGGSRPSFSGTTMGSSNVQNKSFGKSQWQNVIKRSVPTRRPTRFRSMFR